MRFRPGPSRGTRERNLRRAPGQYVVLGFLGAVAVGTVLLSLPVAATGGGNGLMAALFTATSATCARSWWGSPGSPSRWRPRSR